MSGARVAAGGVASDQDALSQRSTELVKKGYSVVRRALKC